MWEEISAQEATAELLTAWIAREELRPLVLQQQVVISPALLLVVEVSERD
jgi:hypothetical protein